jgi:plasmid stabilization system protein ParE
MIRRVAFRPEATAEIADAVDWYETHGKGLGSEFLRSLEVAIANVERNPEAYPVVRASARRALLRRFPALVKFEI